MIDLSPAPPDKLAIWWLGQSGFLVNYDSAWLCFDPYLSDSLSRKYAHTDKPHVRLKPIVVDPAALSFVDVATSTHNHTDHLDAETLLPMAPKQLVIPEANRAFVAARLGCDPAWPIGLRVAESHSVGPFHFTAVPAAHNEIGPECLGYIVRAGRYTLYHSGDTLHYSGMEEILRPHRIDVAFLPINGNRPERRVAGNLDAGEAAQLGHDIGARLTIPCHYDMFAFNTADPAEFVAAARALQVPHVVMELGERIIYSRD